jgi:hypothetical protein
MTKSEYARGVITGSFVLYFIDYLLDRSEKSKGSVIMLKQRILSKNKKVKNIPIIKTADKAWNELVEHFKDRKMHVYIWDAVERMVENEEEAFIKVYGKDSIALVNSFVMKTTPDDYDKQALKESREVTDTLKDILKKVVFDEI